MTNAWAALHEIENAIIKTKMIRKLTGLSGLFLSYLHEFYNILLLGFTGGLYTKIEELVTELKIGYTIVMVSHNMQQAVRISDNTALFLLGDLVESGNTEKMFGQPADQRTEAACSFKQGTDTDGRYV